MERHIIAAGSLEREVKTASAFRLQRHQMKQHDAWILIMQ